jgi:hypothetical protein
MASTATRWPADQVQAQRLDEGALAHARHAADAQAQRLAGVRQQRGQQRIGLRAVVGAGRFEQGDGLGDGAAPGHAPSRRQARIGHVRHSAGDSCPWAFRICSSTSLALAGIGVPGP